MVGDVEAPRGGGRMGRVKSSPVPLANTEWHLSAGDDGWAAWQRRHEMPREFIRMRAVRLLGEGAQAFLALSDADKYQVVRAKVRMYADDHPLLGMTREETGWLELQEMLHDLLYPVEE